MIASKIIAHRGQSGSYPENTAIAMRKASESGVKWIETDVQVSRDYKPFILHDHSLERTAGLSKLMSELESKDLASVDVGSWFDPSFNKERLLNMRDMFVLMKELSLGINLEIKYHKGYHDSLANDDHVRIVEAIMSELVKIPSHPNGIIISSFFPPFLKAVRAFDSRVNVGVLFNKFRPNYLDFAQSVSAGSIHLSKEMLLGNQAIKERGVSSEILTQSKHSIRDIKSTGTDLYVYTVNTIDHAHALFRMGIDGIFTDYPERFTDYLQ